MTSSGTSASDPRWAFEQVLWRLHRPYRPVPVLELLLGVSRRTAREMAGVALATSDEAARLVDSMPRALRALEVATTDRTARCGDGLRGPVLWSETMSARAASAGDPALFVCARSADAYDTDANRVLVAALTAVAAAGSEARPHRARHSPVVREARHRASQAERFLDHRTLGGVPVERPRPRALRAARSGRRRRTYRPALALLERAGDLLLPASLAAAADAAGAAGAILLARCLSGADAVATRRGRAPEPLRPWPGALVAGAIRYRRRPAGDPLVTIGGIEVRPDATDEVLVASLSLAQRARS